jgi:hypothetical protein
MRDQRPCGRVKEDEFFALAVVAEASGEKRARFGEAPSRARMLSQSTGGSVLGLHSCRALPPGPQVEGSTPREHREGRERWKKSWSSVRD